jgi:hypothetical protein
MTSKTRFVALCSAPALLFVLVAGCATPYEASRSGSGYSDFRVAKDVFAVSVRGNVATREERVEKYILRRASELTLEYGFKYFVILSEKERTRSSSVGYSAVKIPLIFPGTSIWIRCFHERPPDHGLPIDAAEFLGYNYPEALEALQDTGTSSKKENTSEP